jgi:hypothetical protein
VATELTQQLERKQAELDRLSKLGWWDRLFGYKVYV